MNSVQTDVENMIDKYDGKAAIEAWRKAVENMRSNPKMFDHWYECASILEDLEKSTPGA